MIWYSIRYVWYVCSDIVDRIILTIQNQEFKFYYGSAAYRYMYTELGDVTDASGRPIHNFEPTYLLTYWYLKRSIGADVRYHNILWYQYYCPALVTHPTSLADCAQNLCLMHKFSFRSYFCKWKPTSHDIWKVFRARHLTTNAKLLGHMLKLLGHMLKLLGHMPECAGA